MVCRLPRGASASMTSGPTYDPVYANNDWPTIIAACQNKQVPSTWIADGTCYKDMTIGGNVYRIDIIGKNHDTYADGSGLAPLTFMTHDCYRTAWVTNAQAKNTGGWNTCSMRVNSIPLVIADMPPEVQLALREINKITAIGDNSASLVTSVDKVTLPSEIEVFGGRCYSQLGEGTQYAYFAAGNTKIKGVDGSPWYWGSRSPYGTKQFCSINDVGNYAYTNANAQMGIAFLFCF